MMEEPDLGVFNGNGKDEAKLGVDANGSQIEVGFEE